MVCKTHRLYTDKYKDKDTKTKTQRQRQANTKTRMGCRKGRVIGEEWEGTGVIGRQVDK